MAARVAHVRAHVLADVRAPVQRNHARLVDHLVRDRNVSRGLEDLKGIAVDRGHHRTGDAPSDTAFVQRQILGPVEGAVAEASAPAGSRLFVGHFLPLRRQGRNPAVLRLHDERRKVGKLRATSIRPV